MCLRCLYFDTGQFWGVVDCGLSWVCLRLGFGFVGVKDALLGVLGICL